MKLKNLLIALVAILYISNVVVAERTLKADCLYPATKENVRITTAEIDFLNVKELDVGSLNIGSEEGLNINTPEDLILDGSDIVFSVNDDNGGSTNLSTINEDSEIEIKAAAVFDILANGKLQMAGNSDYEINSQLGHHEFTAETNFTANVNNVNIMGEERVRISSGGEDGTQLTFAGNLDISGGEGRFYGTNDVQIISSDINLNAKQFVDVDANSMAITSNNNISINSTRNNVLFSAAKGISSDLKNMDVEASNGIFINSLQGRVSLGGESTTMTAGNGVFIEGHQEVNLSAFDISFETEDEIRVRGFNGISFETNEDDDSTFGITAGNDVYVDGFNVEMTATNDLNMIITESIDIFSTGKNTFKTVTGDFTMFADGQDINFISDEKITVETTQNIFLGNNDLDAFQIIQYEDILFESENNLSINLNDLVLDDEEDMYIEGGDMTMTIIDTVRIASQESLTMSTGEKSNFVASNDLSMTSPYVSIGEGADGQEINYQAANDVIFDNTNNIGGITLNSCRQSLSSPDCRVIESSDETPISGNSFTTEIIIDTFDEEKIGEITATIDFVHPNFSDLTFVIVSPNNERMTIDCNSGGGSSVMSVSSDTSIVGGFTGFCGTGMYSLDVMTNVVREDLHGRWVLEITNSGGSTITLNEFSLFVDPYYESSFVGGGNMIHEAADYIIDADMFQHIGGGSRHRTVLQSTSQTRVSANDVLSDFPIVTNLIYNVQSVVAPLPQPIPDLGVVYVDIDIDDDNLKGVNRLEVTVDITHTFIQDLDIYLQSPSGRRVTLFDATNNCNNNADLSAIFTYQDVSYIGDDVNCNTSGGLIRPTEPLSLFFGERIAGRWTLIVFDNFNGVEGTVNQFSLNFNSQNFRSNKLNTGVYSAGNLNVFIDNANSLILPINVPDEIYGVTDVDLYVDIDINTEIEDLELFLATPSRTVSGQSNNVLPILDGQTTTDTITIPYVNGFITEVQVSLSLDHSFLGDLIISVISPSGTTVILHNRECGSNDDIDIVFADRGGDICAGSTVDNPDQELANFWNETPVGVWTLSISDNSNFDQGNLDSWALTIDYSQEVQQILNNHCNSDNSLQLTFDDTSSRPLPPNGSSCTSGFYRPDEDLFDLVINGLPSGLGRGEGEWRLLARTNDGTAFIRDAFIQIEYADNSLTFDASNIDNAAISVTYTGYNDVNIHGSNSLEFNSLNNHNINVLEDINLSSLNQDVVFNAENAININGAQEFNIDSTQIKYLGNWDFESTDFINFVTSEDFYVETGNHEDINLSATTFHIDAYDTFNVHARDLVFDSDRLRFSNGDVNILTHSEADINIQTTGDYELEEISNVSYIASQDSNWNVNDQISINTLNFNIDTRKDIDFSSNNFEIESDTMTNNFISSSITAENQYTQSSFTHTLSTTHFTQMSKGDMFYNVATLADINASGNFNIDSDDSINFLALENNQNVDALNLYSNHYGESYFEISSTFSLLYNIENDFKIFTKDFDYEVDGLLSSENDYSSDIILNGLTNLKMSVSSDTMLEGGNNVNINSAQNFVHAGNFAYEALVQSVDIHADEDLSLYNTNGNINVFGNDNVHFTSGDQFLYTSTGIADDPNNNAVLLRTTGQNSGIYMQANQFANFVAENRMEVTTNDHSQGGHNIDITTIDDAISFIAGDEFNLNNNGYEYDPVTGRYFGMLFRDDSGFVLGDIINTARSDYFSFANNDQIYISIGDLILGALNDIVMTSGGFQEIHAGNTFIDAGTDITMTADSFFNINVQNGDHEVTAGFSTTFISNKMHLETDNGHIVIDSDSDSTLNVISNVKTVAEIGESLIISAAETSTTTTTNNIDMVSNNGFVINLGDLSLNSNTGLYVSSDTGNNIEMDVLSGDISITSAADFEINSGNDVLFSSVSEFNIDTTADLTVESQGSIGFDAANTMVFSTAASQTYNSLNDMTFDGAIVNMFSTVEFNAGGNSLETGFEANFLNGFNTATTSNQNINADTFSQYSRSIVDYISTNQISLTSSGTTSADFGKDIFFDGKDQVLVIGSSVNVGTQTNLVHYEAENDILFSNNNLLKIDVAEKLLINSEREFSITNPTNYNLLANQINFNSNGDIKFTNSNLFTFDSDDQMLFATSPNSKNQNSVDNIRFIQDTTNGVNPLLVTTSRSSSDILVNTKFDTSDLFFSAVSGSVDFSAQTTLDYNIDEDIVFYAQQKLTGSIANSLKFEATDTLFFENYDLFFTSNSDLSIDIQDNSDIFAQNIRVTSLGDTFISSDVDTIFNIISSSIISGTQEATLTSSQNTYLNDQISNLQSSNEALSFSAKSINNNPNLDEPFGIRFQSTDTVINYSNTDSLNMNGGKGVVLDSESLNFNFQQDISLLSNGADGINMLTDELSSDIRFYSVNGDTSVSAFDNILLNSFGTDKHSGTIAMRSTSNSSEDDLPVNALLPDNFYSTLFYSKDSSIEINVEDAGYHVDTGTYSFHEISDQGTLSIIANGFKDQFSHDAINLDTFGSLFITSKLGSQNIIGQNVNFRLSSQPSIIPDFAPFNINNFNGIQSEELIVLSEGVNTNGVGIEFITNSDSSDINLNANTILLDSGSDLLIHGTQNVNINSIDNNQFRSQSSIHIVGEQLLESSLNEYSESQIAVTISSIDIRFKTESDYYLNAVGDLNVSSNQFIDFDNGENGIITFDSNNFIIMEFDDEMNINSEQLEFYATSISLVGSSSVDFNSNNGLVSALSGATHFTANTLISIDSTNNNDIDFRSRIVDLTNGSNVFFPFNNDTNYCNSAANEGQIFWRSNNSEDHNLCFCSQTITTCLQMHTPFAPRL
eukprot:TRINITY_DN797_c0_g1_i1.p1 TRINITY_DN797_c0_g1~~TRINITY_DN797_c0_g1_i1.p1  ORF type:complete len:2812 (-),score=1026.79 TRINITY_DN797_c0_g1_i1:31-8466(-)